MAERLCDLPDRPHRCDDEHVTGERVDPVHGVARRPEDAAELRIPAATTRGMRRGRRGVPLLAVVLAVVAAAFFILPLVGLLKRAPWGSIWDDLSTPQSRDAIRLSVECSLWSTAVSLLLGVPLAWVLART